MFREPITWLAAIALPTVILLIFGIDLRADGARSGARRPALHRGVRPVAGRDHGRDPRHPDAADPPRDLPREGRAAPAVDDARPPAPAARRPAGDLHGHRGHRPGPAGRRRQRRLRGPAAPPAAVLRRRVPAGDGIAVRDRAAGRGARAVVPSGDGRRDPDVLRRDVPRRGLPAAGVPAGHPGQDRRLHAARRPGPPGRVARAPCRRSRRSWGWAC